MSLSFGFFLVSFPPPPPPRKTLPGTYFCFLCLQNCITPLQIRLFFLRDDDFIFFCHSSSIYDTTRTAFTMIPQPPPRTDQPQPFVSCHALFQNKKKKVNHHCQTRTRLDDIYIPCARRCKQEYGGQVLPWVPWATSSSHIIIRETPTAYTRYTRKKKKKKIRTMKKGLSTAKRQRKDSETDLTVAQPPAEFMMWRERYRNTPLTSSTHCSPSLQPYTPRNVHTGRQHHHKYFYTLSIPECCYSYARQTTFCTEAGTRGLLLLARQERLGTRRDAQTL